MNIREDAAKYYDMSDVPINDIPFYRAQISSPSTRVLELGCGTGRVLLALAPECGHMQGVDGSHAMLEICQEKVDHAGLPEGRVALSVQDITHFELDETFDLIIAPFRVLQNLETDADVSGLMQGIARHLAPGGKAILNVFMPNRSKEEFLRGWCNPDEQINGESTLPDGDRYVRSERRPRLQAEPLILFPELIYRRFSPDGVLKNEAELKIAMRCWYPPELEKLVIDSGFRITGKWGGYAGEPWGAGPELVIEFTLE